MQVNLPKNRTGLGPRIIPTFRTIITECTSVLKENLDGMKGEQTADLINRTRN